MKELSKEQIKERAKHLRQTLLEKQKIDLPHGHCLEVMAKVFGFKDWNTASALAPGSSEEKPMTGAPIAPTNQEQPIAAKFQTVGEITEFLSKFDKNTKLVVKEYQWSEIGYNGSSFATVTSMCSLTYDSEIQKGPELFLELNTETEIADHSIGKGSSQFFDKTTAGRSQRRIKYLNMLSGFWNPRGASRP